MAFPTWLGNSVFIAVVVTAGRVFFDSLAGYALARLRFRGRGLLTVLLISVMAVPGVVLMIPKFLVVQYLGIYDTYTAMIVPLLVDAVGVFVMKQFFESVPREIEEAARVDGAGILRTYWSVVLPMARPALITLTILSFQGSWNEFTHFVVTAQSADHATLTTGLAQFVSGGLGSGTQYPLKLTAALLATIPVAIVFFVFQRHFVRGGNAGALKGERTTRWRTATRRHRAQPPPVLPPLFSREPRETHMSTTAPAPATPELAGLAPSAPRDDPWWRTAVVYQIYVRSFRDSTGTGTGDLGGVLERLPYLRRLGVDAIWLSPFYPSPQHDHGYDVADYEGVDPRFGDLDLMRQVIDHAHALGLRVMIDIVPNHCSTDHPWFRAALAAAPESPERALFHFADGRGPDGTEPPNNWRSIFGGSSWARTTTADGTPGQYYLHSFAPEQADFNWADPRVGDYFASILRFWLDLGVDGFRIDVAHGLHKQPGLPDDPQAALDETTGDPVNSAAWNRPEVHDVWRRWRKLTDAYEERDGRARVLVGEIGVLDPAKWRSTNAPTSSTRASSSSSCAPTGTQRPSTTSSAAA